MVTKKLKKKSRAIVPPTSGGRTSSITGDVTTGGGIALTLGSQHLNWEEIRGVIPIIRRLATWNSDIGLVIHDMVQLANTKPLIKFSNDMEDSVVDEMRDYLNNLLEEWGSGLPGLNGLINKLIAQAWITGATSVEWVPNNQLTGLLRPVLVNPETIDIRYVPLLGKYEYYQRTTQVGENRVATMDGNKLVKLNPHTYRYFSFGGDQDLPYGIPPLITALEHLCTQKKMDTNIQFIVDTMGLIGFLEVLLQKPSQQGDENMSSYKSSLSQLLEQTKKGIESGMREGIVVGFEGDHTFKFNSTAKESRGLTEMYNQNKVQVANGAKMAPVFLGATTNTGTETSISVVFTKMLSQLKNTQELVSSQLEFGLKLALILAGYSPLGMKIHWPTSTIADGLKLWQSRELAQRTGHKLVVDGIISQQDYAEIMGYDKPYLDEPLVPYEDSPDGGIPSSGEQDDRRTQQKTDAKRKTNDKKKPLPKRRDNDTRNP